MNSSASHRFSSVPVNAGLEDFSNKVVVCCSCQVMCKKPSLASCMGTMSNFCQCLANLLKGVLDKSISAPDWVEVKTIQNHQKFQNPISTGVLIFVYLYLHPKVAYLSVGVIKDHL